MRCRIEASLGPVVGRITQRATAHRATGLDYTDVVGSGRTPTPPDCQSFPTWHSTKMSLLLTAVLIVPAGDAFACTLPPYGTEMVPFGARKVREFGYQALPHAKRTGHAGPISRAQRQVPNRRGMLWSAWWVNVRESESTDTSWSLARPCNAFPPAVRAASGPAPGANPLEAETFLVRCWRPVLSCGGSASGRITSVSESQPVVLPSGSSGPAPITTW